MDDQSRDAVADEWRCRVMEAGDYEAIRRLADRTMGIQFPVAQDRFWHEDFIGRNPGLCHVATEGDSLIGFVYCGYDGRRATVYHLSVADGYRGRGIGTCLMQSVEAAVATLPMTRARLMVLRSNEGVLRFFQQQGWQVQDDLLLLKDCGAAGR